MALLDAMRERFRAQRKQPAEAPEDDLDLLTKPRTAEAAEAYRLGEKMGAAEEVQNSGMAMFRGEDAPKGTRMNPERLIKATETLIKYQSGKASVDRRVIASQQWWKLNNWEEIEKERGVKGAARRKSNTGWLWNSIVGKHADFVDSRPEPIILPRAAEDKSEATILGKVVPYVMALNKFNKTYDEICWQKPTEGTGVYGVFWNARKLRGLGDIDIKKVNILNLFWESGVENIQDSPNLFYVSYEDKEALEGQYPQLKGKLKGGSKLSVKQYKTDDNVNLDGKIPVIDWYYKAMNSSGQEVLQYCKYVDEIVLYASEDEGDEEGYYHDGNYPFVLDPLFPVAGSPAGYGYIDIGKDSQMDVDTMSQAMVKNAAARATPRYFFNSAGSINEEEFADVSKPLIHTKGNLGVDSLRPWEVNSMGAEALNMLNQKIDEVKFVCGNTDVNNGGVPAGVTAASAIAALKEDSGRSSKASINSSYDAYKEIVTMVIERIRQFYDIPRQFRIIGEDNKQDFIVYSNAHLKMQEVPNMPGQEPGYRLPVFDIDVRVQRENAYTRLSNNELAIQFYTMGIMNPQMTDQALMLLEMMDFRGKDELMQKIAQNGTMQQTLMKVAQIAMALAQRYDPEAAQQLAMVIQGVAQDAGGAAAAISGGGKGVAGMIAPSDAADAPREANENGIVRNARMRAEQASRPD